MTKTNILKRVLLLFNNSKNTKKILTYSMISLTVMSVLLLPNLSAGATIGSGQNPQYISCSGNAYETYKGHVYDQENAGIGGVWLYLYTSGLYQGGSTKEVETNGSGGWSESLISCVYYADLYWQSVTEGPYLHQQSGITKWFNYTANVWEIPINYNLTFEYLYTRNASVKVTYGSQMEFGINAKLSGNAGSKFLGDDISGNVGTNLQLSTSDVWSASGSTNFSTYYAAGQAIKVEAANGSWIEYVKPFDPSALSFKVGTTPSNALTMQDVENNHGSHQWWESVAGYGQTTWTYGSENLTSVSAGLSVTAGFPFGSVTFNTSVEFSSSTSNSISVTLNNSGPNLVYFIVWQGGIYSNGTVYYGGPDYSIWYYGTNQP